MVHGYCGAGKTMLAFFKKASRFEQAAVEKWPKWRTHNKKVQEHIK